MNLPPRSVFVLSDALDLLARTPRTLEALLHSLPSEWQRATEGEGTWSPFDVVGHLIDADRTNWLPRARQILADGESRPFDEFDRFAHLQSAGAHSLEQRLASFAEIRVQSIDELRRMRLGASELERKGTHPAFGAVTLRQLLSTWVVHDLDHVMQITRVLARRYAAEVGPWRAYLRVVRDVEL